MDVKPSESSAGTQLLQGRFEGRDAFRQLVRDALVTAAREGWNELVLSDASFADWPLGEREVVQALQQWSGAGRRFILLAAGFDDLVRRQPRFVQWRRQWDHILVCRKASTSDPLALPSALWSPAWVAQRLDPMRSVGIAGAEPERRVRLREVLDEWLERKSAPAFPATVLGL
ncbi:hypothetical protein C6568_13565 [Melaminivora suipulveris]|uniref:Uncharacterized protein n=1 Tax=Melaminivora suipulveris TaxID=2109913 RepID=A0A2R3QEF9_9BURK|nr:hypothetical protein [Melaminivora suipulveris]AVO50163.1 hypothetical protein C6568_13565 [Melaminivora suipulveris]